MVIGGFHGKLLETLLLSGAVFLLHDPTLAQEKDTQPDGSDIASWPGVGVGGCLVCVVFCFVITKPFPHHRSSVVQVPEVGALVDLIMLCHNGFKVYQWSLVRKISHFPHPTLL